MTIFSKIRLGQIWIFHDKQTVEKLGILVHIWMAWKRIGLWHQRQSAKMCAYFINSWIWNTLKPGVRRLDKGGYPLDLGLVWYELEREFMFQTMKRSKNERNDSSFMLHSSLVLKSAIFENGKYQHFFAGDFAQGSRVRKCDLAKYRSFHENWTPYPL